MSWFLRFFVFALCLCIVFGDVSLWRKMKTAQENVAKNLKLQMDELKSEMWSCKARQPRYYSCDDVLNDTISNATSMKSKIFWDEDDRGGFLALCEHEEDGNYLTIMRRVDDSVDFSNKRWKEYKRGFGEMGKDENFWIGLDLLHKLTKKFQNKPLKLEIVMRDRNGNEKIARYEKFSVGSEKGKYKLFIQGFSGTVAGDALAYSNGSSFSTIDRDNDGNPSENCAHQFRGAGWFRNCLEANLLGEYQIPMGSNAGGRGIIWKYWKDKTRAGLTNQLAYVDMKVPFQQAWPIIEVCNFATQGINEMRVGTTVFQGFCSVEGDGNWLLLMRRIDGSVNFFRGWEDYKKGFGNLRGNFWLGNELIHKLTTKYKVTLRIVMRGVAAPSKNTPASTKYAEYTNFQLGSEEDGYRLEIRGYSGNVGDDRMTNGNGKKFTTKDMDNDDNNDRNCADYRKGAWWYGSCGYTQLTGEYFTPGWDASKSSRGIVWENWGDGVGNSGEAYKLAYAEMKIKL